MNLQIILGFALVFWLPSYVSYMCFFNSVCRRTVKDRTTGQDVILSDADVELLQRIKKGYYADPNYNPYEVR